MVCDDGNTSRPAGFFSEGGGFWGGSVKTPSMIGEGGGQGSKPPNASDVFEIFK